MDINKIYCMDNVQGMRDGCRECRFGGYKPAPFPLRLVNNMVASACPPEGVVYDPYMGSGTTGIVARKLGRKYVGVELNPEYLKMAERRIAQEGDNLFSDI